MPFSGLLCREKRIENLLKVRFRNPAAGVPYFYFQASPCLRVWIAIFPPLSGIASAALKRRLIIIWRIFSASVSTKGNSGSSRYSSSKLRKPLRPLINSAQSFTSALTSQTAICSGWAEQSPELLQNGVDTFYFLVHPGEYFRMGLSVRSPLQEFHITHENLNRIADFVCQPAARRPTPASFSDRMSPCWAPPDPGLRSESLSMRASIFSRSSTLLLIKPSVLPKCAEYRLSASLIQRNPGLRYPQPCLQPSSIANRAYYSPCGTECIQKKSADW